MAHSAGALKASADFTRGGGPPAPDHDADHAGRTSRVRAEQKRLVQWAQENGKLGNHWKLPEFASGGEHKVYFLQRTRRYLKETRSDRSLGYGISLGSFCRGATPSEYLDRLDLQNQIFGDDLQLERIVSVNGVPVIITSQPAIHGEKAAPLDIDKMMHHKNYEKLADGAFYDRKGLIIFDLFPRNVIQVDSGEVYPIDPVIQRITPEFGEFLRKHPETINRDF